MKSLLQSTSNTRKVTKDGKILRSDAITNPDDRISRF